jgi:hypothetical protein
LFVQLVRHVPPLQLYGMQPVILPGVQVPAPSHVLASVIPPPLLLLHEAGTQTVPLAYFWHAPLPSHLPSVPHEAAP